MTTAIPQPTSKTANPPLDITRPFMDDKRLSISAVADCAGLSLCVRITRLVLNPRRCGARNGSTTWLGV